MSLIDLQRARDHLRVEADYPQEQIVDKLVAAEQHAAQFIGRKIFVDAQALTNAIAAVPTALAEAVEARDATLASADAIDLSEVRDEVRAHAVRVYGAALEDFVATYRGVVLNEAIEIAILIILSSLHNVNRDGQEAGLPPAAKDFLHPFRVGIGA